jgi:1-deoxy-D-xylulose-5-phosphate reductoisomerase
VLNAADEVAVEAFLAERLPFEAIAEVVAEALDRTPPHQPSHFEDLFAADAAAREVAAELVETHGAALRAS